MLKNRYVIRKKEARRIADDIGNIYGCDFPDNPKMERAKLLDFDVVLVDSSVDFLIHDGRILFILSSIEKYEPKRKFVTIDMGAIKFIAGGADVMVPGIVDADRDIQEGDPVWIRDENHGKAIAVGISLMNGGDLIELEKGRGVRNIHWVGDRIWKALGEI